MTHHAGWMTLLNSMLHVNQGDGLLGLSLF